MQQSTVVRNAKLDAIEATIGASPTLKMFSGSMPANTAAADAGTVLATVALPSDWMLAAASGQKAMNGVWQDLSADATGTAAYFRIYDSGGTCHLQGTAGITSADMILDTTSFSAGQQFTVTKFTIKDNNG